MFDLRNIDCIELMKQFADNHFDLAIVDPPYGIGFDRENPTMSAGLRKDGTRRKMESWSNPKEKGYTIKDWDKAIPTQEYWDELFRVSKKQIVWGGNYFTEYLEPSGGWIVWEKGVPEGMTLSQAELAWTNCLNSVRISKVLWAGYKKAESEKRFHPTQKPSMLYRWILLNYAKQDFKILDTHLGSGSIAIAIDNVNKIEQMNLTLTGSEIDAEYFNEMQERIKNETTQTSLFSI